MVNFTDKNIQPHQDSRKFPCRTASLTLRQSYSTKNNVSYSTGHVIKLSKAKAKRLVDRLDYLIHKTGDQTKQRTVILLRHDTFMPQPQNRCLHCNTLQRRLIANIPVFSQYQKSIVASSSSSFPVLQVHHHSYKVSFYTILLCIK